jgi:hypothetical protein
MAQIIPIEKDQLDEAFLQNLHSTTFDYFKPGDDFKLDGGYLAQEKDGEISGYVVYRVISKKVIDLAYGGAAPEHRGFKTLKNLSKFIKSLLSSYDLVTTMVWNKNTKMLKIYMVLGFDIVGTKVSKNGSIYVLLEKGREG